MIPETKLKAWEKLARSPKTEGYVPRLTHRNEAILELIKEVRELQAFWATHFGTTERIPESSVTFTVGEDA